VPELESGFSIAMFAGRYFEEVSVVKTMPETTHDWEWLVYTTYKNGDGWGMVNMASF